MTGKEAARLFREAADYLDQLGESPIQQSEDFRESGIAALLQKMFRAYHRQSIIGQKFDRWTVISLQDGDGSKWKSRYLCRCDCGTERTVAAAIFLRSKKPSRSCGCIGKELGAQRATHRLCDSREYSIWANMLQRCSNPKRKCYQYYGGRGITVCERWKRFENFLADMGEAPEGTSLERNEVNGNYELDNCRWATPIEQANNTRRNYPVVFRGQNMTLTQCARIVGVGTMTLRYRLEQGMTIDEAVHHAKNKRVKAYA